MNSIALTIVAAVVVAQGCIAGLLIPRRTRRRMSVLAWRHHQLLAAIALVEAGVAWMAAVQGPGRTAALLPFAAAAYLAQRWWRNPARTAAASG